MLSNLILLLSTLLLPLTASPLLRSTSPVTPTTTSHSITITNNRKSRTCLYLRWRFNVIDCNTWGTLPPRLMPLYDRLDCNLFTAASTLHGILLYQKHLHAPPIRCNSDCNMNAAELESTANHDTQWLSFLSTSKIVASAPHPTTARNNGRFLLWDYIWGLDAAGINVAPTPGIGNIFFALGTAIVSAHFTHRTLVLPPTRAKNAHGGDFLRTLFDGWQFHTGTNGLTIITWDAFVLERLKADEADANNNNNNNNNKDAFVLMNTDTDKNRAGQIWYDPNNPVGQTNAAQFKNKHTCTKPYQQHYDPDCYMFGTAITPLPGTSVDPPFLYIGVPYDPYYVRFGGMEKHSKMAHIVHGSMQLHADVETLAAQFIRATWPQKHATFDCMHVRRGDMLDRSAEYPLAGLAIVDEAKRVVARLKGATVAPVYLAMEKGILDVAEIEIFRTALHPRKLVLGPAAKKQFLCVAALTPKERKACEKLEAFVDVAVCRDARLFVGSFLSSFSDLIWDLRWVKQGERGGQQVKLVNGPPRDDVSRSWYSWWA